jgi:ArsR family transcriptional regulator
MADTIIEVCKALGDSIRLQIVQMLASGERCACTLLGDLDITQPTLSHHMKILCASGLVMSRKDGKWCRYTLDCAALAAFKTAVENMQCCAYVSKTLCGEHTVCEPKPTDKTVRAVSPADQAVSTNSRAVCAVPPQGDTPQ